MPPLIELVRVLYLVRHNDNTEGIFRQRNPRLMLPAGSERSARNETDRARRRKPVRTLRIAAGQRYGHYWVVLIAVRRRRAPPHADASPVSEFPERTVQAGSRLVTKHLPRVSRFLTRSSFGMTVLVSVGGAAVPPSRESLQAIPYSLFPIPYSLFPAVPTHEGRERVPRPHPLREPAPRAERTAQPAGRGPGAGQIERIRTGPRSLPGPRRPGSRAASRTPGCGSGGCARA
jgi:hypothetical protein